MEELYDSIAYLYDGTLEGLFTAVFCAFERHEEPADVCSADAYQPRLSQLAVTIETSLPKADRVRKGIIRAAGRRGYRRVRRAALSDSPDAGTAVYRFIAFAMAENAKRPCHSCPRRGTCRSAFASPKQTSCPRVVGRLIDDVASPAVKPVHKLSVAVNRECEHMRQFIRFRELEGGLFYARCNPKANVVPLIMDHFAERFNVQPFIIFDENHHIAGISEGGDWQLVDTRNWPGHELRLPPEAAGEKEMADAWRRFYRALSVDCRYNPELRRHFMPKRLWKNITEVQGEA